MSNKTPYEIRLEVLAMAKDYFDKQQAASLSFAQEAFRLALSLNSAASNEWTKFVPTAYTPEDVLKKAGEFYSFIMKKE